MRKSIWIKTYFQGLHHWPECPHEDVKFLRDKHEHCFHVRVAIQVSHDDRDLEFIQVREFINSLIDLMYGEDKIKDLGHKSCEMIGSELWVCIASHKPQWKIASIEVSEDGRVGALLEDD